MGLISNSAGLGSSSQLVTPLCGLSQQPWQQEQQKSNSVRLANNNSAGATFLYISLPSLHDNNMKVL